MPNKRDSNKTNVMAFVRRDIKNQTQIELEKLGLTLTDLIEFSMLEFLDRPEFRERLAIHHREK
jgi:hypothetical protein